LKTLVQIEHEVTKANLNCNHEKSNQKRKGMSWEPTYVEEKWVSLAQRGTGTKP